ncbi:SRPBCC family protein [Nocardioides cynanchi]|uniref:SRPBCC family protein n=1 Tax=Nocardioides cynanchi TaxID=2558918 RepID=UPI00124912CF|nr:SRPBCC family protein [Nocardioides cynanchi]
MTTLGVSASGPLPPDEAWERYARPGLWHTWAPQIRSVEVGVERLSGGETGRVHGPLGVAVDFRVVAWSEDTREWSWVVQPQPPLVRGLRVARLRMTHGVAAQGSGSRTWLRVTGFAPLVASYLPVARLALHRLVR